MEIAYAVPFFFILIGIELFVSRRQGQKRYAFADTVTNLSCGIGQQMLAFFLITAQYGAYVWLYRNHAVFHLPASSPFVFVLALLSVDFLYYWFHRTSHRVRFVWATHTVHHQSEEYNLSVALRQSWFQGLLEQPFYWPLALLGLAPESFGLAMVTITLYQFWIHTRVIGKLGPLEWIMNTPSHHRVHHAINPRYIDKNYAGMFIVWDRAFGTFIEEDYEPVYGTVKPLASFNPFWANLAGWAEIARLARSATRWSEKLTAWVRTPEWLPASQGGLALIPEVTRESQRRFRPSAGRRVGRYVFANFVLVLIATSVLMFSAARLPRVVVAGGTCLILLSLANFGGLFEGKRWAPPVEVVRLAAIVGAIVLFWSWRR